MFKLIKFIKNDCDNCITNEFKIFCTYINLTCIFIRDASIIMLNEFVKNIIIFIGKVISYAKLFMYFLTVFFQVFWTLFAITIQTTTTTTTTTNIMNKYNLIYCIVSIYIWVGITFIYMICQKEIETELKSRSRLKKIHLSQHNMYTDGSERETIRMLIYKLLLCIISMSFIGYDYMLLNNAYSDNSKYKYCILFLAYYLRISYFVSIVKKLRFEFIEYVRYAKEKISVEV